MTFKAAACALCIGLACSPAAVLASSFPLKSSRSLQVTEPVEVPGTFNAGDVLNAKKDLVLLKPDKFGYFGTIVLGSSAVYTLKVDKAGTYPVTYALTGVPPKGKSTNVLMGMTVGRAVCPTAGTEGRATIPKFTTGSFTKIVNYRATDIKLKAGVQEVTLCFESGDYFNLNEICIGKDCLDAKYKDTRKAKLPAVKPVVVIDPKTNQPQTADSCVQTDVPISAKPGSCLQVMCLPAAVSAGIPFNTTVRFCLQYPRPWHFQFSLLDEKTKKYVEGANINNEDYQQCGEVTSELVLTQAQINNLDYDWKYYITPLWGPADNKTAEDYPNNIAETSAIVPLPYYLPANTTTYKPCAPVPDRFWNLTADANGVTPGTAVPSKDVITFDEAPECLTPGKPWSITVKTHVGSAKTVDWRTNLQKGSGPNKYLGEKDSFVAESNVYGLKLNAVNDTAAAGYWTETVVKFTAADTRLIKPKDNIYVASFMVPAKAKYDAKLPGGWKYLEKESYLQVVQCPKAAA